ncbi:uncharacterized protein LOC132547158 [Ylistrum balloti]|uniref:uncharacterized protein LOC132547158 n=1 Tax=Ylistrum balloti TaxID=509963 RepID=UPI002905A9B5|nr:uncharacterized protein LOC132547158 [Ylistrum balloti]
MDEAKLNKLKMSSLTGSFKSKSLKKSFKDKCLVIGETTMYYGNFGSVQVMTPIPGSPNLENEAENIHNIHLDSSEESVFPLQPDQQLTPKKEKKPTSQRNKSKQEIQKDTSPKYDLPPLKAVPASVYNCRMSNGREPCHFIPSSDKEFVGNGNAFMSKDTWIPQPNFKPSQTKSMPKYAFTPEYSNLKYGSLGKLIESTNRVQGSSSVGTASSNVARLPAIPGATRPSESSHALQPTAQYINIHKEDGQLPPLKVSSLSVANRKVQEHHKVTKNYQW